MQTTVPKAEIDAMERSVAAIAEAQVTANKFTTQGVLDMALQGFAPRLDEQIGEIGKAHVERFGNDWAEKLSKSYATDMKAWEGLRVAPDIAESIKRAVADGELASARLAKSWEGNLPSVLADVGHAEALRAAEAVARDARRFEAMAAEAILPTAKELERIGVAEAAIEREYLRTPLAAKGFLPADKFRVADRRAQHHRHEQARGGGHRSAR